MYKALVVAFEKGIIEDSNSCWDEALTKSDFMELLTNAYSALPTITNADRGLMEELEVNLGTETTDNTGGVDVTVTSEDGDYQEPTAEEDALASVPETPINEDYSQYSASTQSSINFLTDMFEKGMFTEEEYKIAVDALISAEKTGGGGSSSGSSDEYVFTPEQQAAHDAMVTTGQGDQRTNITYDDVDLPDHLKGDFIN